MPGQKIAVVTDSSAYIPEEACEGLDITVIPLWLIWDEQSYRDGVDIDPSTFYQRLAESDTIPTSSQPSAMEFESLFRELGSRADAIVAVLASSRISRTVASAEAAARELSETPIRIVDSLSSSMGLGLAVLQAARTAAEGKPLEEVVNVAEKTRDNVQLLFVVDTLEYLHKGGRISGGKRLLGTALQIKPILQFEEGEIRPLAQARTKRKAIDTLLAIVEKRLNGKRMAEAAVVDIDNPATGEAVMNMVQERFGPPLIHRAAVSPVVGTHVGPGAVGIGFYPEA
ncbi:MAG: DegV family protein [Anaerolineales bacterium]|jgi:DegV family protein with EDD domain